VYLYKVQRRLVQAHRHHELPCQRNLQEHVGEASGLEHYYKHSSITSWEIQMAVNLLLPKS
jgi:hypothetical protein